MPSRVRAVRYIEARHSSMRTSLSSASVFWRTLMGYPSYARNRSYALPSPSPLHYVMAQIVPVVQLAAHAKSSTLYGQSYGRTVVRSYGRLSKFFRFNGLLLFRIIMGLRYVCFARCEHCYKKSNRVDVSGYALSLDATQSHFSPSR